MTIHLTDQDRGRVRNYVYLGHDLNFADNFVYECSIRSRIRSTTKAAEERMAMMQGARKGIIFKMSLRDHITSEDTRHHAESAGTVQELYGRKREWTGRVACKAHNMWTIRLTTWVPLDLKSKNPLNRPDDEDVWSTMAVAPTRAERMKKRRSVRLDDKFARTDSIEVITLTFPSSL